MRHVATSGRDFDGHVGQKSSQCGSPSEQVPRVPKWGCACIFHSGWDSKPEGTGISGGIGDASGGFLLIPASWNRYRL